MRARFIGGLGLLAATIGCVKSDDTSEIPPTDATYEAAPGRTVIEEIPPNLAGPEAGATGAADSGAPGAPGSSDRPASLDTAQDRNPPPPVDTRPPTYDTASAACSLVIQDCPARMACARTATGVGCVPLSALGIGPMGTCAIADDRCDKGLVCVDIFGMGFGAGACASVCDPQAAMCPGRATCRAVPGNSSVGYCTP